MGMRENNPIQPVNALSNAVDPRRLYPAHFDLMQNLYHSGQQPERWRALDAAEVRLDEDGMEVEFTLVQHGADLVWHGSVLRAAGADRRRQAATNNVPLPAPGMEWEPGNRPPEADPNPTCAIGPTSRLPAAAYVQYRGMKPTAHPCVVAHRHR
jgi:hypothetical protein